MTNKKFEPGELLIEARENKKKYNDIFTNLVQVVLGIIITLIILTTALGVIMLFFDNKIVSNYNWHVPSFYSVVAVNIVLAWVGILFRYYAWVIYFFNVNLGLTDEDWAELRERKNAGEELDLSKIKNPHAGSTLGIPEGTVRGTLALSLAVGALALLIASFGMDTTLPANRLFIDVFDFFKTAFLMMVAFYFGNKSLQYLNYGNPIKGGNSGADMENQSGSNRATFPFSTVNSGKRSTGLPASTPTNSGLKKQSNQPEASAPDIAKEGDSKESIESGASNAKG